MPNMYLRSGMQGEPGNEARTYVLLNIMYIPTSSKMGYFTA